eukprot:7286395-Lingulodinium_polyedra.AAC.1
MTTKAWSSSGAAARKASIPPSTQSKMRQASARKETQTKTPDNIKGIVRARGGVLGITNEPA